ncbi:MAG TPA: hypothetical protein VFA28_14870 [Bryobacteraceae bacterium]|jgi:hypothetical protein|nr:hypothetical protein [Bryobacteraceae bacterium]
MAPGLDTMVYPLGYPVRIATNDSCALSAAAESWSGWQPLFHAAPLRIRIQVHARRGAARAPVFAARQNGFTLRSDPDNAGWFRTSRRIGGIRVGIDTARRCEWFRYHFLEALALTALDTVAFTPVHGACVARYGRALLLCGESGAGKSSLAYACAERGWAFLADDASHLSMLQPGMVVGDCRRISIRESAASIFPELRGARATALLNGKRKLALDALSLSHWRRTPCAAAAGCVFLMRRPGPGRLSEYDAARAKSYFRQYVRWGDPAVRDAQYDLLVRRGCWRLEYEQPGDAVALLDHLSEALAQ